MTKSLPSSQNHVGIPLPAEFSLGPFSSLCRGEKVVRYLLK